MPEKVKWLDEDCHVCGARLNSWDAKVSKALGYKVKVCEKCVAKEYNRDVDELRAIIEDFLGLRPCMGI